MNNILKFLLLQIIKLHITKGEAKYVRLPQFSGHGESQLHVALTPTCKVLVSAIELVPSKVRMEQHYHCAKLRPYYKLKT